MAIIREHQKTPAGRKRSYQIASGFIDGAGRIRMTTWCANCPRTETVNWTHGYDDTLMTRYWTNAGWDFHTHNKRGVVCPDCKKPKGPNVMETQKRPEVIPLRTAETVVQSLTRDQRHKIRQLLDTHFDDEIGRYMNQWSDKRIAESLDLPLASVRELRETAFGPLVEKDPDILKFREEFDAFKSMFHDMERRLKALEQKDR